MNTQSKESFNRRSFIKGVSALAVAMPVLQFGTLSLHGCNQTRTLSAAAEKPANVPWKTTIVGEGERGEPLVVSGTIYTPDGRTPLSGIDLFVYQTDATGNYSTSGDGGEHRNTRIHGLMRTNAEGRYEFRTIKPGSYPRTRNAAHIHAYVSGPGYPEYWIDEYLFADDPFVTEDVRQRFAGKGSFSPILSLTRGSDGVLRGVRDIKVERCTSNCTGR